MLKLVFDEEPPLFLILLYVIRIIIAGWAMFSVRRTFSLSYVTILGDWVCALIIIIHIIQELLLKLSFLHMDIESYFPHFVNILT